MNKNLKKIIVVIVLSVAILSAYAKISFAAEISNGISESSYLIIDPPSKDD